MYDGSKSKSVRSHSLSLDLNSPNTPLNSVPESYWEERWRDLNKEEKLKQGIAEQSPNSKIGWSQRVRMRLSRTESDPITSKVDDTRKVPKSFRKSLLDNLARQLGEVEDSNKIEDGDALVYQDPARCNELDREDNDVNRTPELGYLSENTALGNASICLEFTSPLNRANNHEQGSGSSVASNYAVDEKVASVMKSKLCRINSVGSPLPVSDNPDDISLISGKFLWLWKFGKQPLEGTSKNGGAFGTAKDHNTINRLSISVPDSSESKRSILSTGTSKGETPDQDMFTLTKLGQSMRKNIQVIESVFQQEKSQAAALESFLKNVLAWKGQVTALAALEELWKISNPLSGMDGDKNH